MRMSFSIRGEDLLVRVFGRRMGIRHQAPKSSPSQTFELYAKSASCDGDTATHSRICESQNAAIPLKPLSGETPLADPTLRSVPSFWTAKIPMAPATEFKV